MADWAAAQGGVMGCRNSKVLPEPPGDVQLDLVKKVSQTMFLVKVTCYIRIFPAAAVAPFFNVRLDSQLRAIV